MFYRQNNNEKVLISKDSLLSVIENYSNMRTISGNQNNPKFNREQIEAMIDEAQRLDAVMVGDVVKYYVDKKKYIVCRVYNDYSVETVGSDGELVYLEFCEYEKTGYRFEQFANCLGSLKMMNEESKNE